MNRKKWVVSGCDKDVAASLAEACDIEPFTAFLLCSRGMTNEFEIESFLYDTDLCDPFSLPDMDLAVQRVCDAIENGEKITIFGDFDADGVTSTALVYLYLTSKGAVVDYYIPDRATEGYGMNVNAVDVLKGRGTQLIITVDNGISAVEEICYAKSLGIDVVVTDHHKVGDALPEAVAVVDPHREDCDCDFTEWAGVGVAFKFISAIEGDDGEYLLEKYGDIIALGTVADIVPLKGENRIIVKRGIEIVNYGLQNGDLRPGLKALSEVSAVGTAIDSGGLAFRLAPKINAAGRMYTAEKALQLLISNDEAESMVLAEEIVKANSERQSTEAKITESAIEYIESNPCIKYSRILVVDGEDWHQGVIGIVASRLVEKYGKPCIVISKSEAGAKGSGRSLDGFDLYDALAECSDVLRQFGGHTLAAGLSLDNDRIDEFRKRINDYAATRATPVPVLKIDCKLNPLYLDLSIISSLSLLEPFGAENPQPVFGLFNMRFESAHSAGNGKYMILEFSRNMQTIKAIWFSPKLNNFDFKIGDKVDVAVKIGSSEYQGKERLSIQIKDIRFSDCDEDALISAVNDYEEFCRSEEVSRELKEKINIDRDFCGSVYRAIRGSAGWKGSAHALARSLKLSESRITACLIALDVLQELGIVECRDEAYYPTLKEGKTNLENSRIFKKATK